jgi:hypothetical protein
LAEKRECFRGGFKDGGDTTFAGDVDA